MRFTWDEAKRLVNLEKHDLDFADAALVYEAADKVTLPVERHGERRLVDIAMVEVLGRILLLAYVLRGRSASHLVPGRTSEGKENV